MKPLYILSGFVSLASISFGMNLLYQIQHRSPFAIALAIFACIAVLFSSINLWLAFYYRGQSKAWAEASEIISSKPRETNESN